MKKIIPGAVIAAFILTLILLLSGIISNVLKERGILEKISVLPSFSFITLTKDDFHSSEIEKGPLLIVRFHPGCDHCQYEISEILKSDIPEMVIKMILISSEKPDSISKFLEQFNYRDFPSVIALADTADSFGSIFGKDMVPANYIYNKELKLVKVILGEVKTETIRKYLLFSE